MAYSKNNRIELANKASHSYIIQDEIVGEFIKNCKLPKKVTDITIEPRDVASLDRDQVNPIEHVIVIDGGTSTVPVREEFPSSEFTFIQFGALKFENSDLEYLSEQQFIGPEDISKLKEDFGRLKLAVPIKNIIYKEEYSLLDSVRKSIFEFFCQDFTFDLFEEVVEEKFIDAFKWLIFEEYSSTELTTYTLGSCPNPNCLKPERATIPLKKSEMNDYTFKCPYCDSKIYLTDVFRLHELIDEDIGAFRIITFLLRALEQMLLVLILKIILETNPVYLKKTLFIQDGPLAFFAQTAKLFASMQKLINHLFDHHDLFLIGLEKSGVFVDHAEEISKSPQLNPGDILILDTKYIYKYIKPGDPSTAEPFGRSTYYGNKIIFKSKEEKMYVATLAMNEIMLSPNKEDFRNLDIILTNIENLKCELYNDAILPLVLVNRLVSLSDRPGSTILGNFSKKIIDN